MSRQYFSVQHMSILGISQLLLTWFWPNFKGRFFGPSLTYDICPGIICPYNICTFQHQPSWWHLSRQHMSWQHKFVGLKNFGPKILTIFNTYDRFFPATTFFFLQEVFLLILYINFANILKNIRKYRKYQPSGAGGTRPPPATAHRLQNPKWLPGGSKMADGFWKGVCTPRFLGAPVNIC